MCYHFTVYITTFDIEKSFSFITTIIQITCYNRPRTLFDSCANKSDLIIGIFSEVWELERSRAANVTFKVTQGHLYWCHSIGHIRFPISLPGYYHI